MIEDIRDLMELKAIALADLPDGPPMLFLRYYLFHPCWDPSHDWSADAAGEAYRRSYIGYVEEWPDGIEKLCKCGEAMALAVRGGGYAIFDLRV